MRRVLRRVSSVVDVAGEAYVAVYVVEAVELAPWPPRWVPAWLTRPGMPPETLREPSCGPKPGPDAARGGPEAPGRSTAVAVGSGDRAGEAA